MDPVTTYLKLVERVFNNATQANIDAVEAFERAHPSVVDEAYRRGQAKAKDKTVRIA
jgi:hypothetical protein